MDPLVQMLVTIICSVLASSGFWAYFQKRSDKRDDKSRLLVGLAHDRILFLGSSYLERGDITKDEYENLYDYLYIPYKKLGGNGSAERVMTEVMRLPIKMH